MDAIPRDYWEKCARALQCANADHRVMTCARDGAGERVERRRDDPGRADGVGEVVLRPPGQARVHPLLDARLRVLDLDDGAAVLERVERVGPEDGVAEAEIVGASVRVKLLLTSNFQPSNLPTSNLPTF